MIERIYNPLKAADVDVRLATLHTGACTAPYCVLYEGQSEPGRTVAIRHALIDVLVPAARPELLAEQTRRVQTALTAAGIAPAPPARRWRWTITAPCPSLSTFPSSAASDPRRTQEGAAQAATRVRRLNL